MLKRVPIFRMSLSFGFMICAACLSVGAWAVSTPNFSQTYLDSVFGTPENFQHFQVVPLVPSAPTTDIDANPEDYYKAPLKNYDSFDWTLTKRVSMYTTDNFVLSPLGIKLGLAILAEAATGKTQQELAAVAGFERTSNGTMPELRKKFADIINSLQLPPLTHDEPKPSFVQRQKQRFKDGVAEITDAWTKTLDWFSGTNDEPAKCGCSKQKSVETNSSDYILNLGSRVYIDDSTSPQQHFAASAEANYRTQVKSVHFADAAATAAAVSAWVSELTKGKIRELIKPHEIENQVMMIVNALYFKGTWLHQFDVNDTKQDYFYVTPTDKRFAHFMNIQNKFHYVESVYLDSKIVRMPFLGKKFSMYIVVPNSLTGLARVMENVGNLRGEMFHLDQHIVSIRLPKFEFDASAQLDGVLRELGIKEAFLESASFPGITRGQQVQKKLKISRVLQKAGIEVNEVGSTAYAATEISLVNKFGISDNVQEVFANKPFLFFIEDEATRQLLFTGRLNDPTQRLSSFKYSGNGQEA